MTIRMVLDGAVAEGAVFMAADAASRPRVSPAVRFEWGPVGAALLAPASAALVVVDVLSFTTSVCVAVERGTAVYPSPWRDSRAPALAERVGAVLAVGRSEVTREHPWSLSPAALAEAPAPTRLVLPSPNGSAIAAASTGVVVAACLRNASAVGRWLADRFDSAEAPVTVIAAGERWPDGSLRPAVEDLLGAGAVIDALSCHAGRRGGHLSPEAEVAVAAFRGCLASRDVIRDCASGRELVQSGFIADVEIAAALDVSPTVPVLVEGAFRTAPHEA